MTFVQRVLVFGSFARGEADRWSDIDLLVVTANRMQFWQVFTTLARHRTILWRSRFVPQCDPSGGYVLGIVFEGESVFHNVDLNFMTLAEYHMPDALNRFGTMKEVYAAETLNSNTDDGTLPTTEAEHPTTSASSRVFTSRERRSRRCCAGNQQMRNYASVPIIFVAS